MNDISKIFLGITFGLLIALLIMFIPMELKYKPLLMYVCIYVTATVYDNNADGEKKKRKKISNNFFVSILFRIFII